MFGVPPTSDFFLLFVFERKENVKIFCNRFILMVYLKCMYIYANLLDNV